MRISDWSSDVCSSDLLAQPLLAIEIVAVLAAVAVAGGPGDDLDHLGPLDGLELLQLGLQPRQPCRRDVVLCPGRDRRRRVILGPVVKVAVGLSGESLTHGATLPPPCIKRP